MKGAIIYKTKYYSTLQYAEWIARDLGLQILNADRVTATQLAAYDYVIIGTPVYFGKMLIKRWLKKHDSILRTKQVFLFVVCATPDSEKDKQRKILSDNLPLRLLKEKDIFFMPGRISQVQMSALDRFMLRMGAKLQDVDGVQPSFLLPFLAALREYNFRRASSITF